MYPYSRFNARRLVGASAPRGQLYYSVLSSLGASLEPNTYMDDDAEGLLVAETPSSNALEGLEGYVVRFYSRQPAERDYRGRPALRLSESGLDALEHVEVLWDGKFIPLQDAPGPHNNFRLSPRELKEEMLSILGGTISMMVSENCGASARERSTREQLIDNKHLWASKVRDWVEEVLGQEFGLVNPPSAYIMGAQVYILKTHLGLSSAELHDDGVLGPRRAWDKPMTVAEVRARRVARQEHDEEGRLTAVVHPDGTRVEYDERGQVVRRLPPLPLYTTIMPHVVERAAAYLRSRDSLGECAEVLRCDALQWESAVDEASDQDVIHYCGRRLRDLYNKLLPADQDVLVAFLKRAMQAYIHAQRDTLPPH